VAEVGKGTYIRTLAHDIAESVAALGVVICLHRTKDGPFDINQAVALDDNMEKNILPMEKVLGNLSKLNVSSDVAKRLICGQRIKDEAYADLSGIYAVMCENQLVALGEVEKNVLHPRSIFATKED
jgi:tRNA pseudouridine55 synthase